LRSAARTSLQSSLESSSRRGGRDEGASSPRADCSHSRGLETAYGGEAHPFDLLARHAAGDWGELCTFDRHQNEIALREGLRVLSSYPVEREYVWVITEADRSVTTILLPEEY
jgi:hypothetical protein